MEPMLGDGLPTKAASRVVLAAADSVDSFCMDAAALAAADARAGQERRLRIEQVPQGPLGLLCLLAVLQHLREEGHGRLGLCHRIGAAMRSSSRGARDDRHVVGEPGGKGPKGQPDGGVCSFCLADGECLREVNCRSEVLALLYPEPGAVIGGSLEAIICILRSIGTTMDGSGTRRKRQTYIAVERLLNSKVQEQLGGERHSMYSSIRYLRMMAALSLSIRATPIGQQQVPSYVIGPS